MKKYICGCYTIEPEGKIFVERVDDGYNFSVSHKSLNTVSPEQARALADAIYAELGLGWLPYPENRPEPGFYQVKYMGLDRNGNEVILQKEATYSEDLYRGFNCAFVVAYFVFPEYQPD